MEENRFTSQFTTVTKKNPKNWLESIISDYIVDYGKEKFCKKCNKRLNYMNAKISRYCHTCKDKVIRQKDIDNSTNNKITPKNAVNMIKEWADEK